MFHSKPTINRGTFPSLAGQPHLGTTTTRKRNAEAITFGLIPMAARVFFMSMAGVVFQVGLQTAPGKRVQGQVSQLEQWCSLLPLLVDDQFHGIKNHQ